MKKLGFLLLLASLACSAADANDYVPVDGDIVFQTSTSNQSQAIQLATGSRYSHVGVVFVQGAEPVVLEAVQPVKLTPLQEWIQRGEAQHYVVKRLAPDRARLTAAQLERMTELGRSLLGTDYDLFFEWSDERIYCSELVWKLYAEATGIRLGELEQLGDFDLTHPQVRATMSARFGDDPPLDEAVISPAALFDAPMLTTVFEND